MSTSIAVLTVVFGTLYGIKSFHAHPASAHTPIAIDRTSVSAVVVRSGPLHEYLDAIGSLKAVRQVVIAPEVGGAITTIHFESGGLVSAGDPILQMNDAPERGDLERYRGMLWYAERDHDRQEQLIASRAAPKAEVESAKSRLNEARGLVMRTEAVIAQKRLCAPFDGVLGIRQVDPGQYLQPGQPVVSLTNLDRLYVNFTLPEKSLPRLKVGLSVEVAVDAFPSQTFQALLTTIEPQVYVETRTVSVQGTIDNRNHELRPGMSASVRVILPVGTDVVTVPETALVRTIAGDSVFIVQSEEKGTVVDRIPVKAGRRTEGLVVILDGLNAGDTIVSSGQLNLSPGSPVTIAEADDIDSPPSPAKEFER